MLHYADIKCITLCEKVITLCTSLLRYAKKLLRYAVIITLCGNYYVMRRHKHVAQRDPSHEQGRADVCSDTPAIII